LLKPLRCNGFGVLQKYFATKVGQRVSCVRSIKTVVMAHTNLLYRPCRFCPGKRSFVEFYVYCPDALRWKRFKRYVDVLMKRPDAMKAVNSMMCLINDKLARGWNPGVSDGGSVNLKTVVDCVDAAIAAKSVNARPRTKENYLHRTKIFKEWMESEKCGRMSIGLFDSIYAQRFIEWLMVRRCVTPVTANNYLIFCKSIWAVMVERGWADSNVFTRLKALKTNEKMRRPFDAEMLDNFVNYCRENEPAFLLAAMYLFYALIRPGELRALKVGNIDFDRRVFRLSGDFTKNGNNDVVPIVPELWRMLMSYGINKYPAHYFLVSDKFLPGPNAIYRNAIPYKFRSVAKAVGIPNDVVFYSLKDTVAQRLLDANYDIRFIQMLFRHSDISITEKYLSRFKPLLEPDRLENFPSIFST
jgi:integrase